MAQKILFLSAEEVRRALPMPAAVEAMKEAFRQISERQTVAPPRLSLEIPAHNGDVLVMPVYSPQSKLIGLKLATLFGNNPAQGLPLLQSLVLVMDGMNGSPLAVMNGAALTAIRTGAASGAATDLLARRDARIAAIFGAGVQGRSQLEAVCAVRAIEQAFIFDPHPDRARAFAEEMSERLSIPVSVGNSPEMLREADLICTATGSGEPVFADRDLMAGVHVNAIGSYKPHKREIPAETVLRAKVVVDQREACRSEAGDLIIPLREGLIGEAHIYAEVGEILNGEKPGRESETEITLFKSVGNAAQDLAAAGEALQAARKLELGVVVGL